jgi:hypothetical protein
VCDLFVILQATGSVKAAAALAEFHARRLPTGGPEGLAAQVRASVSTTGLTALQLRHHLCPSLAAGACTRDPIAKAPSFARSLEQSAHVSCTQTQAATLACADLHALLCSCTYKQAAALIEKHGLDDTTYLYDLGNTTRLFKAWRGALPRVMPFYAVKCNPEVRFLHNMCVLHALPPQGSPCVAKPCCAGVFVSGSCLMCTHSTV